MRFRPIAIAAVLAFLAIAPLEAKNSSHSHHTSHKGPAQSGTVGEFDYYVMALSWSPTFCELHPDEDEQCGHKGFGFVLHGLWPQYEGGGGPERCTTDDEPDRKTVNTALAFMPSRRLITHEWVAHGACTGMDPSAYFSLADRAFAAVHVPAEFTAPHATLHVDAAHVRAAFKRANTGLTDEMMSLHCSRGELVEVRVCLSKELAPRECGKRMQSRCPASASFDMPASN
ncbi:MAG TPA: ribonuclease T2 [Rhodanobacteraceae bacterium]|nr:ribonuclease T2 [Rhodanobacteraceae bacterium]